MRLITGILLVSTAITAATAAEPQPAYPPSPVIAAIEWAPVESIVRQAKDGDIWPVRTDECPGC
jgi:hypothetical protein